MNTVDIFNAKKSVIANGLEGKVILIYGGNNRGKTYQAVRLPKPFVVACESGLNGIDGVSYLPVTRWSDFKMIIDQFTSDFTRDKAKEMYSTIIIDEVYASSLYCQDYVCQTFGNGALTLADGDTEHNLYQLYEKEYFKQINLLVSAGYTVVFIAHEQENTKTHFITPKGDKRCINPIIDKCDYVVYLTSNGVDSEGKVINSSAYLAQTNSFFARARIKYTPTFIKEFTAENLTRAIQEGIDKKRELDNAVVTDFKEQQEMNTVKSLNFDELKDDFNKLVFEIPGANDSSGQTEEGIKFQNYWQPHITQIIENYLGKGKKVSNCTPNQAEALSLIVRDLERLIEIDKKKMEEEA